MNHNRVGLGTRNELRASKRWFGGLILAFLTSCGGGSSGGSPTPTPSLTAPISVSASGLRAGQQIVLASGSDRLTINANGSFSFGSPVAVNASYAVTIATEPSGETCALNNATGTVQAAVTIHVTLSCGPTILHSFAGADGSSDLNVFTLSPNVTLAADGNLYGTIVRGGTSGFGTIFKLTPSGQFTVLHHFAGGGADGKSPEAALFEGPGGELYGTTVEGGAYGFGTIFKITREGAFTLLHSFSGAANDGASPKAALIQSGGAFYGTTYSGGQFGRGTVFRVTSAGAVTVLYSFASADGDLPSAPLIEGSDGSFYGTTSSGGPGGGGRVFRITPDGTLTSLHDFDGVDGSYLYGPIVRDNSGNLFGTTYSASPDKSATIAGNIFKLSVSGEYAVLHQFMTTDGAGPVGGLTFGLDGNIYGTTSAGGENATGTIFRISAGGDFAVLHIFPGGAAGRAPRARLIQDQSGVIYGTTSAGGANNLGTIFKF